ncbi:hypothetical protein [Aquibacillus halophilus]|nr:hypothetical protein [Aquibacillus halophilus]
MNKKVDKINFKKSYESDGVMGKDKKQNNKKDKATEKDEALFFNSTESSE